MGRAPHHPSLRSFSRTQFDATAKPSTWSPTSPRNILYREEWQCPSSSWLIRRSFLLSDLQYPSFEGMADLLDFSQKLPIYLIK